MRPRVFPAENGSRITATFNEAAGIPRGKRPVRRPLDRRWSHWCTLSFNEAAGIPRGKLQVSRRRPFNDAGRRKAPSILARIPKSFNEAAGIPRGKHRTSALVCSLRATLSFNEAAGIPRGKLGIRQAAGIENMQPRCRKGTRLYGPSMRPRVFPAENR